MNSHVSLHKNKIWDESLHADVEKEHNYAEESHNEKEQIEEHNIVIQHDDTCARSLDQTIENLGQKNEIQESFSNNDIDPIQANKSFEEVSSMNNMDTSVLKNIKENEGSM
ncbi:hypothetical protein V9T40_008568 [Parthenolecanium corni]|uniref:Uncharacterized protein n=1 Tax=Parthenolecanium corni TaxID=536013 RepID=A0AAN9Y802_9HEMI